MDERGANIDLLFRNGLKDYEALPPVDSWDTIYPVIKRKQRPVLVFRAAATFAVLVSLGLLTYRWSTELSSDLRSGALIINEESELPDQRADQLITASVQPPIAVPLNMVAELNENPVSEAATRQSVTAISTNGLYDEPLQNTIIDSESAESRSRLVIRTNDPIPGGTQSLYYEPLQEDKPQLTNRWSVAALVSPAYYNRMSSGNNEAVSKMIAEEKPVISYTGGVSLAFKVSRRFTVQSGIYYSSIGQNIPGISSYAGFNDFNYTKGTRNFDVITVNGTIYTKNGDVFLSDNMEAERVLTRYTSDVIDPVKAELDFVNDYLRQNFSYLEFPVLFRYKLIDKTLDLNIVGGVSSNFLVGNSVYTPVNGAKYEVGETDGLNPVTISSSLGMGMEYSLSGKVSLNLEPTFRYYINPFSNMPGMKINPYSFGVFSGITYRF